MGSGIEYVAIAGLVLSAVGTGVSVYSQQQQAQSAQAIANYNAQIAEQNNKVNLAIAKQQASWQEQQALAQADARTKNAAAMQDQARLAESQAREEARRMREENDRKLAIQRARYGKAGVTSEGSPLAIMSESAALLELGVQDVGYKANLDGMAWDRKAALKKIDAGSSLFDAGIARYQSAAADAGFSIAQNKAKVDRMAGSAAASAYKTAAFGTLIGGASDALSIGSRSYFN